MLEKLDDLVYNAASRPLIELLQKWFHFNRFRLIASCLLGIVELWKWLILVMCTFTLAGTYIGLPVNVIVLANVIIGVILIAGEFRARIVRSVIPDLLKCSIELESGKWPKPSTGMIARKTRLHYARGRNILMVIVFMTLYVVATTTGPSAPVLLPFLFFEVSQMLEGHLWRSSDVDPKDRRTITEPERQASSAS